jgi:Fic-DOC domain mobile mystery protein B
MRQAAGATPLDPDEANGLLPRHITTQGELNEWEQQNIMAGAQWAMRARADLLTDVFVRTLHRKMFDKTWKWAGTFRRTEKNIGVDPAQIAVQLRDLLENTRYWLTHGTYPVDECAIRFHHRLVLIHPFPNGNGRHARLLTDLLLRRNGAQPFTWGGAEGPGDSGDARERYLAALREADSGDVSNLLRLART